MDHARSGRPGSRKENETEREDSKHKGNKSKREDLKGSGLDLKEPYSS